MLPTIAWYVCAHQTHRCTDAQTHTHSDTQTHRHTDAQTHRHTHTHTYRERIHTERGWVRLKLLVRIGIHVCCSGLQWVAVCCGVLQCVAVCCSVLQCVALHSLVQIATPQCCAKDF